MPVQHTKAFGIYHWDTFDNVTLLVEESDSLPEAEAIVATKYGGRIGPHGADRVDVVNQAGTVVAQYTVA